MKEKLMAYIKKNGVACNRKGIYCIGQLYFKFHDNSVEFWARTENGWTPKVQYDIDSADILEIQECITDTTGDLVSKILDE
jgi:hypothetical protein